MRSAASDELPKCIHDARVWLMDWAARYGCSEPEAAYQQVCLAAWKKGADFDTVEHPGAWMKEVVRNFCREQHRRQCRELPMCSLPSEIDIADVAVWEPPPEPFDEIWPSIDGLPCKEAETLIALFVERKSVRSYARESVENPDTIKSRKRRACHRLRQRKRLVQDATEHLCHLARRRKKCRSIPAI